VRTTPAKLGTHPALQRNPVQLSLNVFSFSFLYLISQVLRFFFLTSSMLPYSSSAGLSPFATVSSASAFAFSFVLLLGAVFGWQLLNPVEFIFVSGLYLLICFKLLAIFQLATVQTNVNLSRILF